MSSLVELVFSAVGTQQAAAEVAAINASLEGMSVGIGKAADATASRAAQIEASLADLRARTAANAAAISGSISAIGNRATVALSEINNAGILSDAAFLRTQSGLAKSAAAAEAGGAKFAGFRSQIEGISLSLRDRLDGAFSDTTKHLLAIGAAALSVHAVYEGLKESLNEGQEFSALSLRTGESIRNLVVLDQAFRNANLDQTYIAQSSSMLARALEGLNEQGGHTEGIFHRLGTSIAELKPLGYYDQLVKLREGFQQIESPAERAALAVKLFGRAGSQMLEVLDDPQALSRAEAMAGAHADQLQRDAQTFREVQIHLDGVNTQLRTLWTGIMENLLPGIDAVATGLGKINLGGVAGVFGTAGLEAGGGLVALMGVDVLDRKLVTVAENFAGSMTGAVAGVAGKFTGVLATALPFGLAAGIAAQIVLGLVQASEDADIKAILDRGKRIGDTVKPYRDRLATVGSSSDASALKSDIDAEVAKLEALAAGIYGKLRPGRFGNALGEGDKAQLSEINEEIVKLKGESQNFLGNATAVAKLIAANQLAAVKASIAPLLVKADQLQAEHDKLTLAAESPAAQSVTLARQRAGLETERANLPGGLSPEERKVKLLDLDNKIAELAKQEAEANAKVTAEFQKQAEEKKKQAAAEEQRQIYALETQMEVAKASGNDALAQSLKEQIEQKRAAFSLDGLDLDLVKQRIAAEHQIWVEQQAQAATKKQIEAERASLDAQLTSLRANLAQLEGDYTRTDAEKWAARKAELDQEIADLTRLVELEKQRAAAARARGDEPSALEHDKAGQGFSKQLAGAQGEQAKMGPNPDDWVGQSKKSLTELRNSWGTTAQQIGHSISSVIGGALSSVSQNITGLINGTETWAQAFARIGLAIESSIISAIVDMGVKYVATKIMMAVTDKSIAAANVAAMLPIALATSSVWAGPAALATIASWGGAAAAAPVQIGMAMAATQGLALAETGGYFPGRDGEVAGIFHGNEFIFSAPAVRNLGAANLAAMHQAALRPASSGAAAMGGGAGGAGGGRQSARNTHIYLDRSAWLDAVRSDMTGIAHEVYNQRSRAA